MLKLIKRFLDLRLLVILAGFLLVVSFCFWWYGRPQRSSETIGDVAKIVREVHRLYAGKASYWGLNTSALQDVKTLRRKNSQIITSSGKTLLVGQGEDGDTVMPTERTFDVIEADLTFEECINTASLMFETPETLGLMQTTIVGSKKQVFEWGAQEYPLPISRQNAKKFCADNSKIIWTFE